MRMKKLSNKLSTTHFYTRIRFNKTWKSRMASNHIYHVTKIHSILWPRICRAEGVFPAIGGVERMFINQSSFLVYQRKTCSNNCLKFTKWLEQYTVCGRHRQLIIVIKNSLLFLNSFYSSFLMMSCCLPHSREPLFPHPTAEEQQRQMSRDLLTPVFYLNHIPSVTISASCCIYPIIAPSYPQTFAFHAGHGFAVFKSGSTCI